MNEKTFGVPNMNCGGCQSTIEDALAKLDDVAGVDVELEAKRITVRYGADGTWARIRTAVESAGFTVSA